MNYKTWQITKNWGAIYENQLIHARMGKWDDYSTFTNNSLNKELDFM